MKKIKENNIMDEMVKRTQVYLNAMYGGNSGYEVIPENGITGWTTIYEKKFIRILFYSNM